MPDIQPDDFIRAEDLDWDNATVVDPVPDSERAAHIHRQLALLQLVVADYDRRREHWWGRFLLWLLRKTT